ncbi:unnamed protein product [Wuchereria bancrofti]|uniref:Uncharacterized protein n=1 Tax=Wuchereria bancrofti TaxID=6293 RepID=A0A3P7E4J1_WUCBA|nr:unnamed protein product [Wuchereria bancrofti]
MQNAVGVEAQTNEYPFPLSNNLYGKRVNYVLMPLMGGMYGKRALVPSHNDIYDKRYQPLSLSSNEYNNKLLSKIIQNEKDLAQFNPLSYYHINEKVEQLPYQTSRQHYQLENDNSDYYNQINDNSHFLQLLLNLRSLLMNDKFRN